MSGIVFVRTSNEGPDCSGVLTLTGGDPPGTTTAVCKRYNGSTWDTFATSAILVDAGSGFVEKTIKINMCGTLYTVV